MKVDPLVILLNKDFVLDKKFYFVSGNEVTLMEKIVKIIIERYKNNQSTNIQYIGTINEFVDEIGLFEDKKIYFCKNCKGIDKIDLNELRETNGIFIFFQENSQKIKSVKNLFIKNNDSYVIDCYELSKESKVKIINESLKSNKKTIEKDVYWLLTEKLDNKYIFLENNLNKITSLEEGDITVKNVRKLLTIDDSGKEKLFFILLQKNREIIQVYRDKIINTSDVSELYYYCKYFCQMIIDCKNEDEYNKKIPSYLFREKGYLFNIYRNFGPLKKKKLIRLLFSTEKNLRDKGGLSLITGLRFILNIKKIVIS